MLQNELQQHQWKAFRRNPMFERNMSVRIFMYIMFGFLALQLFSFGFFLDNLLLEVGEYSYAIYTFNSILLFLFLFDFLIKYTFRQSQSMQIAPYLCLPVKRNRLFNFLLTKEFSSIWNLYYMFLLIPFAIKAIIPYYGFFPMLLYILFFYSMCIGNSLLTGVANGLLKRNGWFFFLPYIVIAAIVGLCFIPNFPIDEYTVKLGEWVIKMNPLVWIVLILLLAGLWMLNLRMMRSELYREMQGKKVSDSVSFSRLSFLDRLGETGEFINLEIKIIMRSKRLKQQTYVLVFLIAYYFFLMYSSVPLFDKPDMMHIFFLMFTFGGLGLFMAQYMFMAESSFFDGMMARHRSLLNMIRGKYLLYISYSILFLAVMLIPIFQGKVEPLFVISVFFYTTGGLNFLMFQNAVYNKSYFDLFDGGMFNWKGTTGNTLVVTLIGMFAPLVLVKIVAMIFSMETAIWFMLVTGMVFTFGANIWLKWTYKRFLKRKYTNMEGFRSNG